MIDELAAYTYLHDGGPVRARLTALTWPCRVVIEVEDHSAVHRATACHTSGTQAADSATVTSVATTFKALEDIAAGVDHQHDRSGLAQLFHQGQQLLGGGGEVVLSRGRACLEFWLACMPSSR